jgi:hypothetical protein
MAKTPGGKRQAANFEEFLNPNSMITPGAAGAFTMVITNTLVAQFAGLPGNYTALAVSFLFGAVVFTYAAVWGVRLIYFVINSLIIFVMAHGSNTIGAGIERRVTEPARPAVVSQSADASATFKTAGETPPAPRQSSPQGQQGQQSQPPPPPPKPFFRQWL